MMLGHIKTSLNKNPTVAAIEDYIRENGLSPGDPMPSEAALVELLGVSRSSVREAMRTLASLDVVTIRHGYGTCVGSMSLAPLVNGMILRLTLNEEESLKNLSYVVETREALDNAIGEELIRKFTPEIADELRGVVKAMAEKYDSGETFREEDFRFHEILQSLLENELIREFSVALWEIHNRVVPMLGLPTPKDMDETVAAHADIIDALEDGDIERYQQKVKQHYYPLRRVIELRRKKSGDADTAGDHQP